MKVAIQNFEELSDSRELYETRPFPFGVYFTYIVFSLVAVALLWASFSDIDVVVKSIGEVRPYKETNTISNAVSGRVKEIKYKNGDYVEQDDIILKLDIENFEVEHNSLLKQINHLEKELNLLDLYKESVTTNTNLLGLGSGQLEENYYFMFKKYEMDLSNAIEKSKLYKSKVSNASSQLKGSQLFLESIEKEANVFGPSYSKTESYQKYVSYLLKVEGLKMTLETSEKEYKINTALYESGSISETKYHASKVAYDQATNQLSQYMSDTKLQLKTKLEEYKETIYNYEGELSSQSNFKTQTLININNQVQNKVIELDKLKSTLDSLNINIDDTELRSPVSGYVNFSEELTIGQYLAAGLQVATIIPENGEMFKVQMYVPNKDISDVDVGDKVKYRFDALPYKEYGVLEGEITSISVDASLNKIQGMSYYLVESTVKNEPMVSYKGTEANIKVGMSLEAQVISESKKVLYFLLDKIDLWS